MAEQNLSVSLVLNLRKFIDGFRDAKQVASTAGADMSKSATIEPKVNAQAINAVKAKLAELTSLINTSREAMGKSADLTALRGYESIIKKAEGEVRELTASLENLEKHSGGLKEKFKGFGEGVEKISGSLGNLGGAIGGGLLGGAAFSAISSGISEIVEKAKELDDAQDGLSIALSRTTLTADQQGKEFESLQGKAEEIGDAFALPKTQIMNLQSTIVGFSGITGKQLDDLTELSIGASQALGMPAEAVARMIAKAADPEQEAALKRLGIVFEKNATTAEKMAVVEAKLGPSIKAAKDAANDGLGAFERMKETVQDVVINVAQSIMEALRPVFDVLSAILKPVMAIIGWLGKLLAAFNPITIVLAIFRKAGELLAPVWQKVQEVFEKLKPTFTTVGHMFSELWNSVKGIATALFTAIKHLFGFGEGAKSSSGFMEKLGKAIEFVAKIIETTVRGIQGTVSVVKLIVDTISAALSNFDILHPAKMLEAFDGFGEKAKAAFNAGFTRTDTASADDRPEGEKKEDKAPKEKKEGGETQLQKFQREYDAAKTHQEAMHALALNGLQRELEENPAKEKEIKRAIEGENMNHAETIVGIHTDFAGRLKAVKIKSDAERKKMEEDFQLAISNATLEGSKARVAINNSYDDEDEEKRKEKAEKAIAAYREQKQAEADAEREARAIRDDDLEASDADEYEKSLARLNNKLDDEQAANDAAFDKGIISEEEYEAHKSLILKRHALERNAIVRKEIEENNLIYKTGMAVTTRLFDLMSDKVKAVLGSLFGWEKDQNKKKSETERRLDEIERQKKIAGIKQEIEESKISREEGLLEIQKLNEDAAKSEEEQQGQKVDILQELEKTATEGILGELAKRGEAYVADALVSLIADQGKALGGAVASIFSSLPWFVALPIAAGAGALIYSLLAPAFKSVGGAKKAMKGMKHDPSRGGEMVYMEGSHEGGRTEFVAPEHEFLGYAEKELGPKLVNRMAPSFETALIRSLSLQGRQQFNVLSRNGGVPLVSPALSSSAHVDVFGRLQATLDKQNAVLLALHQNGVQANVEVSGQIKMDGRDLAGTIRNRDKHINRRSSTTGGGLR